MRNPSARAMLLSQQAGAAPAFLAALALTTPTAKTLRLSNGILAKQHHQAIGQEWPPLVLSWGDLEVALNALRGGGTPAGWELELRNTMPIEGKARVSALIRSAANTVGTYVFPGAVLTVYQLLELGADVLDAVTVGAFVVEELVGATDEAVRFRMIDQAGALERGLGPLKVDLTKFPSADPDDVGKVIPTDFGALQNVPGVAIVAGQITFLMAAMPENRNTVTVITVRDASRFRTAGSLRIGVDTWTYAKISATQLRLSTPIGSRPHPIGTPVIDLIDKFVFAVGRNRGVYKYQDASNVMSVKTPAGGATINKDDTAAAYVPAGESLVTISFTVPPGTIVSKTTGTDSPPFVDNQIVTDVKATNIPVQGVAMQTIMAAASSTKTASIAISVPTVPPPGTIRDVHAELRYTFTQAPTVVTSWKLTRTGGQVVDSGTTLPVGESRRKTWALDRYRNDTLTLTVTGSGLNTKAVLRIDGYVQTVVSIIKAPDPNLTIADIIFGQVTCDVAGLQDDALGTISGTPSLLLEVPHDVTKCLLTAFFGVLAAQLRASVWAATRAAQVAAGLKWAFRVEDALFSELVPKLGEQGQAELLPDSGEWLYKYRATAPVADKTFVYGTDFMADGVGTFKQTPANQVANALSVYSQRDFFKSGRLADMYRRMRLHQNLAAPVVGDPDVKALPEDVELDLVQDLPTAIFIGDAILARRRRQRFGVDGLETVWNGIALEGVDYVAIKGHPVVQDHGDDAVVFEVRHKVARASADNQGRIALDVVEAGP